MARNWADTSTAEVLFNNSVTVPASGISVSALVNLNNIDDLLNETFVICSFCDPSAESNNFDFGIGDYAAANDTKLVFETISGGPTYNSTASTTEVSLTGWHQVGATWDGSNVNFYIDGVIDNSPAFSATGATASMRFMLGKRRTGTFADQNFAGYMAEVGYWQRVLTDDEMNLLGVKNYAPILIPTPKVYVPLYGNSSPEVDVMGFAGQGTVTGTSKVDHPPVVRHPSVIRANINGGVNTRPNVFAPGLAR